MLPAHQCLDPENLLGVGVDLGLVVQHQLAGVDGLAQLAEEGEPAGAVLVELVVEQDEPRYGFPWRRTWRCRRAVAARRGPRRGRDTWPDRCWPRRPSSARPARMGSLGRPATSWPRWRRCRRSRSEAGARR